MKIESEAAFLELSAHDLNEFRSIYHTNPESVYMFRMGGNRCFQMTLQFVPSKEMIEQMRKEFEKDWRKPMKVTVTIEKV